MVRVVDYVPAAVPALALASLKGLLPWQASLLVPLLYGLDLARAARQVVEEPKKAFSREKRKARRLNGKAKHSAVRPQKPVHTPWRKGVLAVNALLTLLVLDHALLPHLASTAQLSYTRVSALSPSTAHIAVRLPGHPTTELAYRPLSAGFPWEFASPLVLSRSRDWSAEVPLTGLLPGLEYEYRVDGLDQVGNFTTFPSTPSGSPLRFVHAGQPSNHLNAYHLPRALWRGPWATRWSRHVQERLRNPAWDALAAWVQDMKQRTAWTAPSFALVGGSLKGQSARQLLFASRTAFETLPIMPARLESPSRSAPEPGALAVADGHFSHGNAHFFRIHPPTTSFTEQDDDWQVDVDALKRQMSHLQRSDWKFFISPVSLSSPRAGSHATGEWRQAILDLLADLPNTVLLAESSDFQASLINDFLVEIATPSLDGGHLTDAPPGRSLSGARSEHLLKHIARGTTNWASIEVQGPNVYVVFVRNSEPVGRLTVVGEQVVSHAVGSVTQSFRNLLRSFGLVSTRWF